MHSESVTTTWSSALAALLRRRKAYQPSHFRYSHDISTLRPAAEAKFPEIFPKSAPVGLDKLHPIMLL